MADKRWHTYEEVAQFLLNQCAAKFGLERVEGKQHVAGHRSGMSWEIDGKGVYADGTTFVILECRRYTTSRLKPEAIGGVAYRIIDTGAKGAIVVSPLGFQEGGELVGKAEGIVSVVLTPESTNTEYLLRFLNQIRIGHEDATQPIMDAAGMELAATFEDAVQPISDGCGMVLRDSVTGEILEIRGDPIVVTKIIKSQESTDK